jgi:hypothetical protein
MADKRKPMLIILLRFQGKKMLKMKKAKIELFDSNLWDDGHYRCKTGGRYRIRVNGKWFNKGKEMKYFTKTQVKNITFKSIKL